MSSDLLNPTRVPKITKAMKAERTIHRITFNPSSANPGDDLFITLPKLRNDMVFVPYSTFLRFDLEIAKGDDENSFAKTSRVTWFRNFTVGTRNTEGFVNPKITSVVTTIDGVPHKLFSDGMLRTDLQQAILNRVGSVGDHFNEKDFHNDKFALWMDFRASPDNLLHGDGEVIDKTNDGVRLGITWAGRASTTVTCYVFLVSDAAIFVRDGRLQDFKLK